MQAKQVCSLRNSASHPGVPTLVFNGRHDVMSEVNLSSPQNATQEATCGLTATLPGRHTRMKNSYPGFPCAIPNIQKTSLFLPIKRLHTTDKRKPRISVSNTTATQSWAKHVCFFLCLPTPVAELGYQSLSRQPNTIFPGGQT